MIYILPIFVVIIISSIVYFLNIKRKSAIDKQPVNYDELLLDDKNDNKSKKSKAKIAKKSIEKKVKPQKVVVKEKVTTETNVKSKNKKKGNASEGSKSAELIAQEKKMKLNAIMNGLGYVPSEPEEDVDSWVTVTKKPKVKSDKKSGRSDDQEKIEEVQEKIVAEAVVVSESSKPVFVEPKTTIEDNTKSVASTKAKIIEKTAPSVDKNAKNVATINAKSSNDKAIISDLQSQIVEKVSALVAAEAATKSWEKKFHDLEASVVKSSNQTNQSTLASMLKARETENEMLSKQLIESREKIEGLKKDLQMSKKKFEDINSKENVIPKKSVGTIGSGREEKIKQTQAPMSLQNGADPILVTSLQSEINRLAKELTLSNQRVESLQNRLETTNRQVNDLKSAASCAEQTLLADTNQKEEIEKLTAEMAQTKLQYEKLSSSFRAKDEEIKQLKIQNSNLEKEKSLSGSTTLSSKVAECEKMNSQIENLTAALTAKNDELERCKVELVKSGKMNQDLQAQADESNKLADNIKVLENSLSVKNKELESSHHVTVDLDKCRKELDMQKNECKKLTETVNSLKNTISEKDSTISSYEPKLKQLSSMEQQVSEKSQECDKLKKEIEQYKANASGATVAEGQIKELKSSLELKTADFDKLKQSEADLKKMVAKKDDEISSNEKRLKEFSVMETQMKEKSNEIEGLKKEIDILRNKNQESKKDESSAGQLKELQANLKLKTTECEKLKQSATKVNESHEDEMKKMSQQIKEKSQLLEKITKEKELLSKSSNEEANKVTKVVERNGACCECDKYKGVLSNTESLLSNLQKEADQAQEKWVKQLQKEVEQKKKYESECKNLKQKIDSLESETNHKTNGSLSEASVSDMDANDESMSNKVLIHQLAKLRSLVNIGQDALREEQKVSAKLREQLSSAQN